MSDSCESFVKGQREKEIAEKIQYQCRIKSLISVCDNIEKLKAVYTFTKYYGRVQE